MLSESLSLLSHLTNHAEQSLPIAALEHAQNHLPLFRFLDTIPYVH